jgi:hypothetical protein
MVCSWNIYAQGCLAASYFSYEFLAVSLLVKNLKYYARLRASLPGNSNHKLVVLVDE